MTDPHLIKSLGYVTVSAKDIDRWRHFAFRTLGFAEGTGPDPDALYLRMDERAHPQDVPSVTRTTLSPRSRLPAVWPHSPSQTRK